VSARFETSVIAPPNRFVAAAKLGAASAREL